MSNRGPRTFIGRYYHALEQKGRLSIPAAFRSELSPAAVITSGLDGCLFVYPQTEWEKLLDTTANLPYTKKNARDWIRLLTNNANYIEFDRLGRIQIPEYLREQGKLIKNVVVVGSLDHVEIWDRDHYHTYLEDLETRAEAIAETIEVNHE